MWTMMMHLIFNNCKGVLSMENLEEIAFQIISLSGDAKSDTLIALKKLRSGNYEEAHELLDKAEGKLENAANVHLDILSSTAETQMQTTPFLLVHAEDHYSTATYSHSLIKELIGVFEDMSKKTN